MQRSFLIALVFLMLATAPVYAASVSTPTSAAIDQPALISFGGGYYDFDKTEHLKKSGDIRLEYRWGTSLLPLLFPSLKSWDSDVQFHPMLGFETITRGALYSSGGFDMDWYITKHWIFTWSEAAGFYYRGNGPRMGSFFQFRSEAEGGWRFDNNVRVTAEFSHISDAKITNLNPGAEIIGLYLHVPTSLIFGK